MKWPAGTWDSMKIQNNMSTFCFHGKSVSNIFPWVFTKSKNFLQNYILAIKWVEDCSWASPIQLITTQFIFHLQSNAGEFTQLTRMSARRLLTKANLLAAHKPDLYEQYGGKFWKRSYCGYSKPKHINNHPFLLVWLHLCLGISFCSLL